MKNCDALTKNLLKVIFWLYNLLNISDGFSEEKILLKPQQQKRVHWKKTGDSSSRGLIPKAKIKTVKMTFVIVLGIIV